MNAFTVACLALSLRSAPWQGYRLNGPLTKPPLGRVDSFLLSPSGERVVFIADLSAANDHLGLFLASVEGSGPTLTLVEQNGASPSGPRFTADETCVVFLQSQRLWTVPSDGSLAPAELAGTFVAGGAVSDFLPAPRGDCIVFRADKDTDGVLELWSVPADSSAPPVRLSGALIAGGQVAEYRLSPDGSRVVYRADQEVDERFDLFSAPTDGSSPAVRLNATRPGGDVQTDFAPTFDGRGVVYRHDQDYAGRFELFVARIEGGVAPQKRSGTLVSGGSVADFELSPVDDRLVYRADKAVNDVFELWSVHAISGGASVKLNGTLLAGTDVFEFALSSDGTVVVYPADQGTGGYRVYGVPADGSSASVLLSQPIAGLYPSDVSITDFGGRALYRMRSHFFEEAPRLFSVPLDGSQPPVELPDQVLEVSGVLPDGSVLLRRTSHNGVVELYSVPVDASAAPLRLNGPMLSGHHVLSARWSANRARAVYLLTSGAPELFSVPASGGEPRRLSPPLPRDGSTGKVSSFVASHDGTHVAYVATEDANAYDLYDVATDGSGGSRRINAPIGWSGVGVGGVLVSPDGARILYEHRYGSSPLELRSSPVGARAASVQLDGSLRAGNRVEFTPDSANVLYRGNSGGELGIVPSDGSAPARSLHPGAPAGHTRNYVLAPNGAWVAYWRKTSPYGSPFELFSVPLDGHQPPTRLHAPFPLRRDISGDQADVHPVAFTPDSTQVLYLADQDTDDVTELWAVPIDGSQAPRRLNAPFGLQSDVVTIMAGDEPFLVTADGTTVVYRADQDRDELLELYRVPLAGGPAVKLNGSLVPGGSVSHFVLTADSKWALFVASERLPVRNQLWSVPLDGSAARVLLNDRILTSVSWYDLRRPFLLAAGERVVYRAANGEHVELWSVPVDGSAAPVRLNALLPDSADVEAGFLLSADRTRVVYAADQLVNDRIELFVAPVDGNSPSRRVNGELVPGGDVSLEPGAFHVSANDLVLYLADQDVDGRIELFASALDWQRGPRRR